MGQDYEPDLFGGSTWRSHTAYFNSDKAVVIKDALQVKTCVASSGLIPTINVEENVA